MKQLCCLFGVLILASGCSESGDNTTLMLTVDVGTPSEDAGPRASDSEPAPMADADSMDSGEDQPDVERPDPVFGLSTQTVMVDGETRSYLIYVPESYDGSAAVPVMLSFHGGSGDANAQLFTSNMRPLAESERFLFVLPEGSRLDTGDTHWNPVITPGLGKSDTDDYAFVGALLDDISANYRVDETRVYATGYSNGAGMAWGLACYLSDRIAAVAPVSGLMYEEMRRQCRPSHPTGILNFNGTQDFERPYNGIDSWMMPVDDAIAYWTGYNQTEAGMTASFETRSGTAERTVYSNGNQGAEVINYKIIGGGHDWFDLDIDGLNIDQIIWQFVSRFSTDGAL